MIEEMGLGTIDLTQVHSAWLFDDGECERITAGVFELQKLWQQRAPSTPFYTLGTSAYQDASELGAPAYYAKARLIGPVLRQRFSWVYDRVMEGLMQVLDAPVQQAERFAPPGFHIFLAHPWFQQSEGSRHCDLQHDLLDWPEGVEVDSAKTLSFTLPVALPKRGGGMRVWDVTRRDVLGLGKDEREQLFRDRGSRFYEYKVGSLEYHSGQIFHAISHVDQLEDGDNRITLQGHGLNWDGTWHIYW